MEIDIQLLKDLREETGAGVMDVKRALVEANGDVEQAKAIIAEQGLARAAKREDRTTQSGLVYAYVHGNNEVGVLVELNCETSFVAQTDEFKQLAHELALQIAAMDPTDPGELLEQDYIRDAKMKVNELLQAAIAKTGENIVLKRFTRFQLGSEDE